VGDGDTRRDTRATRVPHACRGGPQLREAVPEAGPACVPAVAVPRVPACVCGDSFSPHITCEYRRHNVSTDGAHGITTGVLEAPMLLCVEFRVIGSADGAHGITTGVKAAPGGRQDRVWRVKTASGGSRRRSGGKTASVWRASVYLATRQETASVWRASVYLASRQETASVWRASVYLASRQETASVWRARPGRTGGRRCSPPPRPPPAAPAPACPAAAAAAAAAASLAGKTTRRGAQARHRDGGGAARRPRGRGTCAGCGGGMEPRDRAPPEPRDGSSAADASLPYADAAVPQTRYTRRMRRGALAGPQA
jgi:hypothetical protein